MPLKSNGIRPHVYDLKNEPNPTDWRSSTNKKKYYQDDTVYYYTPGKPTLAQSYVNYKGKDISHAVMGYEGRKRISEQKFKSVDTMLNALERANVVAVQADDAIIARWDPDQDYSEVRKMANKYEAWRNREVYRVDWVEDPSIEGIGDPIYHNAKRTEPAGEVKRSNKIFGKRFVDKAVQRERDNLAPMADRRYDIYHWSYRYDNILFSNITQDRAMLLGFSGQDMRLGETADFVNTIDGRKLSIKRMK